MADTQGSGNLVGKIVLGIVIAVMLIAGGGWGVYWFVTANDGADCAAENADRARDGQPRLPCP